jgi:hypothetical protein
MFQHTVTAAVSEHAGQSMMLLCCAAHTVKVAKLNPMLVLQKSILLAL